MNTSSVAVEASTLYKYKAFNASALSLIANREIYFASPGELNDPCDSQISITASLEAAIAQREEDPARKVLAKLERLRKPYEIFAEMERDTKKIGILSLTKDNLNVLMWSHYADEHKGLCFGFRFSSKVTEYNEENKIIGMASCHYCGSNPFSDFFVEFDKADKSPRWEDFWHTILSLGMVSKSEAWRYENEVRILRTEPGFVSIQNAELTEVIFGMRMEQRARNTVKNILTSDKWGHLKYSQVIKQPEGFGLAIVDA